MYARLLYVLLLINTLSSIPATAHEYWIEPQDYLINSSEEIVADFRNGQFFEGNSIPYIPDNFERYDFIVANSNIGGNTSIKLKGELGQRPAVRVPNGQEGLGIIIAETNSSTISYTEWEKFQKFIDHKDFKISKNEHLAMGFPETGFKETYRRFAKSLVGIGHAKGRDRKIGMEVELVALLNPYTDDTSDGMPVMAYYDGAPLVDVQIELFDKDEQGKVNITLHRTDDAGQAILPITSGHSYLVDTVVLRKAPQRQKDVVWETLWASLTYAKE